MQTQFGSGFTCFKWRGATGVLKNIAISLTPVVTHVYILGVGMEMGPEIWSPESLYHHSAPAAVGPGLHLSLCNLELALSGLIASWEQIPGKQHKVLYIHNRLH